jgi:hypothetical protein
MEHDEHEGGGCVAVAVVNDQVAGAVIALPAVSFAPLTVAVYCAPLANAADGVNVAFWVALSYDVVPLIAVADESLRVIEIVLDWTGSLNVAVTLLVVGTPVAPAAGLVAVTVGGVVSVVPPPPPPEGENTTSTQ